MILLQGRLTFLALHHWLLSVLSHSSLHSFSNHRLTPLSSPLILTSCLPMVFTIEWWYARGDCLSLHMFARLTCHLVVRMYLSSCLTRSDSVTLQLCLTPLWVLHSCIVTVSATLNIISICLYSYLSYAFSSFTL